MTDVVKGPWQFLFALLTYILGSAVFFTIQQNTPVDKMVLDGWILIGFIGLYFFAIKQYDAIRHSALIKRTAFLSLLLWLAASYANTLYSSTLSVWLLWMCTPLICTTILILIPQSVTGLDTKKKALRHHSRLPLVTALIIVAILLFAILLHSMHAGALGYVTDEGSTALYAHLINTTGLPCSNSICYLRGLPYLYTVAAVTHFFGVTEFWVRFATTVIEVTGLALSIALIQHLWKNWKLTLLSAALLSIADWQMMLGRYARMYGTMLLFLLIALWAYSKAVIQKKYRFLPVLFIASTIAMLTHQFGMLLIFFIVEPAFSKRFSEYKNPYFLIFCALLTTVTFLTLTKVPGIIYLDAAYTSIYDLRPYLAIQDTYWYLQKIQFPNLVYLKNLFLYYPLSMVLCIASIITLIRNKHQHRWVAFFVCWVIGITAMYRIDYDLKYLWWILAVIHLLVVLGLLIMYSHTRILAVMATMLLIVQFAYGDLTILNRAYGQTMTKLPILAPAHVTEYYPDDKTPVSYVLQHAQEDDIILTDYWLQDAYLQIGGRTMSNGFITRWNDKAFLKKFPYYKLYDDSGVWRLQKNGPELISTVTELTAFMAKHSHQTLWYISSVDFQKKPYLYISSPAINSFIKDNFQDDIVYKGKDKKTVVYKISFTE